MTQKIIASKNHDLGLKKWTKNHDVKIFDLKKLFKKLWTQKIWPKNYNLKSHDIKYHALENFWPKNYELKD